MTERELRKPMRTYLTIATVLCSVTGVCADTNKDHGRRVYHEQCASCHGEQGEGVAGAQEDPLLGDASLAELTQRIHDTMPEGEPEACQNEDAKLVAEYIYDAFYSEAAQLRNNPPRLRLAHLTGVQLRRSLSDLYAHFQRPLPEATAHGLQARYYKTTRRSNENLAFERVDATVDFDFGHDGPGQEIPGDDFAVQWTGAIQADVTGTHEITVRSTCAFMCYLGDSDREFINNNVQSGDKTEFRRSVTLTAGQIVPLRIDYYQRKRKTEQPPARISLSWTTPVQVERLIPTRNLLTVDAPPVFTLQTRLPPDDRSYGYERGINIDRQWDESTTEAALEFADVVATDLWPRASGKRRRRDDDEGERHDREKLRSFLTSLVSIGFRQPLDDSLQRTYIDDQLAATDDDREAITRVVVAMVKSPRFLYPTVDTGASLSHQRATRLALVLFDSLPSDDWLVQRAAEGQLETLEEVNDTIRRMMGDVRVRGKTRELLYSWLNLNHASEITKDSEAYPDFNPQLVADLRQSLDMFIDEVVWSEASDFRQLLTADWSYTNSRIASFYGDRWNAATTSLEDASIPSTTQFFRTESHPDFHAGVLTHPYMMSRLAYQNTTSPIHRGVFLIRYVLGRTIRPPQAAFTPLSPDLHPELTTRQRVSLQTGEESCQVCHVKINGVGFVLENFDAVGRFRTEEHGKPVDARGNYSDRQGTKAEFIGADALSEYLATSDDVHRAFVDRAFEHFCKQPAAAYGPTVLDDATRHFVESGYNIRELLVEIAVIDATCQNGE